MPSYHATSSYLSSRDTLDLEGNVVAIESFDVTSFLPSDKPGMTSIDSRQQVAPARNRFPLAAIHVGGAQASALFSRPLQLGLAPAR